MPGPEWLKNAVVYEIYPQSFQDSNGDGIGDLPGIIAKLDYIKDLGVNTIWLNPCFESPFQDAGYDISDYYKVAPRYGTNADMKKLFEQAHRRGLKVLLDLVAGHTSMQHPWFKESCKAQKNKYSNYFIWTNSWGGDGGGYRFINGYAERDGNFMINFFYCQPALNYGFVDPDPRYPWQLPATHPDVKAVREELRNIMKFWLEMGCDGFRVDMAASLVRGNQAERGINELWHDYRSWLDKNYPEAVLVSEWSHPAKAIDAGFHIDFMVHFGLPGYTNLFRQEDYRVHNSPFGGNGFSYFDRTGKGDAKAFVNNLLEQLKATAGKGYVAIPTGNHDIGRIRQGRTDDELKTVYAMIFTLPGVPFLYYGDEIGMDYVSGLTSKEGGYNRTGSRTPMLWGKGAKAGFSTAAPKDFYLPLPPENERSSVAAQEKKPDSLLHFVQFLIKLRRENPALAGTGSFRPLYAEDHAYPLVYERAGGRKRFVIAVNPSGMEATAEFGWPDVNKFKPVAIGGKITLEIQPGAAHLVMSPASYAIYGLK